jgi:predicted Zn-dependent protease
MDRRAFIASLIAAVGVTELVHVSPALAGIDEPSIGREVYAQLRESGDLLFDSSYYEHLNEIGSVISETVRTRYPYPISYFVVRGDAANAFSVPGGNIYVNEPLLRLAKNRDELAGVLAHETGHMVKHHVAKRMAEQNKANVIGTIGQIAGSIFGGWIGGEAAGAALGAGAAGVDANLSRKIETEADEEGARIMAATKVYNPYGMVWFFDIMAATYGPGQKNWLNDHPMDAERMTDLHNLLANNPDIFGSWKDTSQKDAIYW